jgi:hypothetical protein
VSYHCAVERGSPFGSFELQRCNVSGSRSISSRSGGAVLCLLSHRAIVQSIPDFRVLSVTL